MNAAVDVVRPARSWSGYQQAIFDFAAQDVRPKRLVIKAGAGSGKTTTGEELVRRLNGSHIFLAFNRRQDWQKQQEKNLCYVAATRAKIELVLIPSPKKGGSAQEL